MLLIYSHTTSPRLQYTCQFIFKEIFGVDYNITIDSEEFLHHKGAAINYTSLKIKEEELLIESNGLLFETSIKEQPVEYFISNGHGAFFNTNRAEYPFDILSAIFYLLSRYEEYLPHQKDAYGRYAHENSLAYREGFLQIPLINYWLKDLAEKLKNKFPSSGIHLSPFKFIPSYDIDIAYSYKHKGFIRNVGGFIKSPSLERIKVLLGRIKDPFDCYSWLKELHTENHMLPLYFFLVAEKNGRYDKNILPFKNAVWKLVKQTATKYTVGIHPSWQSSDDPVLLANEKEYLEAMCETKIVRSRQHYIRFNLPDGYDQLLKAGITDDYSMGYGSINGFRASVSSAFYWYDLPNEKQTNLRIHPFCFMDANAYYEQKQTPAETAKELDHYLKVSREINGTLITIWHNNFLGTAKEFAGWKEIYQAFIHSAVSG